MTLYREAIESDDAKGKKRTHAAIAREIAEKIEEMATAAGEQKKPCRGRHKVGAEASLNA
jgi:hypothetical protein